MQRAELQLQLVRYNNIRW